jgi:hypothetical protein
LQTRAVANITGLVHFGGGNDRFRIQRHVITTLAGPAGFMAIQLNTCGNFGK